MELTYTIIQSSSDVGSCRRSVRAMGERLPFSEEKLGYLELIVTELANNLLAHHAEKGVIVAQCLEEGKAQGIEVIAMDLGPGISRVEEAMRDGVSSGGTLGIGLGSVVRNSDEFDIISFPSTESMPRFRGWQPTGTGVMARLWVERPKGWNSPWRVVVHEDPCPGETVSGDGVGVWTTPLGLRVVVCDGLGHGPIAHDVSQRALDYCANSLDSDLFNLVHGVDEHLRGTRGCAFAVVDIHPGIKQLSYLGVGNLLVRMVPRPKSTFLLHRGIVGTQRLPKLRVRTQEWSDASTLWLASDGLSYRWDLESVGPMGRSVSAHDPSLLRHFLVRDHRREHDDVTVVAVQERS